ncbi:long-chain-fatty-acid--CoA ligase [Hyalangium versicolor]|uniref:long-chain-fatty-acid--CoA ligase n=1 Tax=Hyalangium versicolor TaxID=2861190 RepID=UPI001CCE6034|nr:long-chain-fatty-acid--CoA ligase [Hyalangium versicolor]
MKSNIGLFLTRRAQLNPGTEAAVDVASGRRFTYAQLNARCNRVAHGLLSLGVGKGDRVALLMLNSPEFLETFLAIAKIGAVCVPLNWRLIPDELALILRDSGARVLISSAEFDSTLAELHSRGPASTFVEHWVQLGVAARPEWALDYDAWTAEVSDAEPQILAGDEDVLYIMYTSGTTGLPKGVTHSHKAAMWAVLTFNSTADMRHGDRYLVALPLFHVGALTPVTACIHRCITAVIVRQFDPSGVWEVIQREQLTTGLCVPTMLDRMLQAYVPGKHVHSSLRWMMSGAAPVPETLIRAYAELGIEVHQVYGLTECCGPACLVSPENALARVGSTGKAFFFTEVRVVRHDGTECAPREAGEVLIRGEHVMAGYWNQPQATAETLRDGWLYTGDVAMRDEEGFIYIQDRLKDLIISGGENIYPAELENVLRMHPKVRDTAVIGRPSKRWGESPLAVIVKRDDSLTESEVLSWCQGRISQYKLPKGAVFIPEIPRNSSGKILKRALREQFPGFIFD